MNPNPTNLTVAITGAAGFIGSRLVSTLTKKGAIVRSCLRSEPSPTDPIRNDGTAVFVVGNMGPHTDWSMALEGTAAVIHTAARVHILRDTAIDPLDAFREVNVRGTLRLARQAIAAGVRRFVYISSIKVNGEQTEPGQAFTAEDTPAPVDPYGISKYEAEQELLNLAAGTQLEVVIVRPPLVYGPGVKGNFATMIRAIQKGMPLPFGSVNTNRRSMVALDNLVDLLVTCVFHPMAAGQIFLVRDGEDLSTAACLRRIGWAMETPARLLPAPEALLRLGATLIGRPELSRRLLGNLQVDDDKTKTCLAWMPMINVDEGLRRIFVKPTEDNDNWIE